MNKIFSLNEILPFIPTIKKGKYDSDIGSFILIGGSSYKCIDFDKFDVKKNDQYYRSYDCEKKYPNISFQSDLAKISTCFSFDRPTDLLNNNLYRNDKNKNIYIASQSDLTIKSYAKFIYELLIYHDIKPPYIFIAFGEGGYDLLSFSKFYPKIIKHMHFIDTPFVGKYLLEYEKIKGNMLFWERLKKKHFFWNKKMQFDSIEVDKYNFDIKTYNIIMKLNFNDFPTNIPIKIFWSPYIDIPKQKSRKKISIINKMSKELSDNVECYILEAPHQIERVLPKTLLNLIIADL